MIEVEGPDGTIYEIDTDDEEVARRTVRKHLARQQPGYQAARRDAEAVEVARTQAPSFVPKPIADASRAIGGFVDQAIRNTGAGDEIAGGGAWLSTAASNLLRPGEGNDPYSAGEAYRAAADLSDEQRRAYAAENPIANAGSIAAGVAFAGRPTLGAPRIAATAPAAVPVRGVAPAAAAAGVASTARMGAGAPFVLSQPALKTGAQFAAVNAPLAFARQDGDLGERLPGAALETAFTFGLGTAAQGLSNVLTKGNASQIENLQAFEQAGVRPSYAAIGGPGAATVAKAVAENPIAGMSARGALQGSVDDTAAAAARIAEQAGTPGPVQTIGERVQRGVEDFAQGRPVDMPDGRGTVTLNRVASEARQTGTREMGFAGKSEALYGQALGRLQNIEKQRIEAPTALQAASSQVAQASAAEQARMLGVLQQQGMAPAGARTPAQVRDALARAVASNPQAAGEALRRANVPLADPEYRVVTSATRAVLGAIQGRVGASNVAQIVNDPLIGRIANAVNADQAVMRLGDLRQLRTWVREAQRNPQLRQGMDDAALQRLEAALTDDILSTAHALAGREGVETLLRADQYYRAGMQRIQNALQPFANAKSGEGAYQAVIRAASNGAGADVQKLLSLKRSLGPDDWNDLRATVIANLGRPSRGAANAAEEGAFSISTFVSNYASLSDRGRRILFGDVGGGGQQAAELHTAMEVLARVAGMQKGVERAANASNTAVAGQSVAMIGGIGAAVANPSLAGPMLGGLAAMTVTGEVMTNPAFVRWLAGVPRAGETVGGARKHLSQLALIAAQNPELKPDLGAVADSWVNYLVEASQSSTEPAVRSTAPQAPVPSQPAPQPLSQPDTQQSGSPPPAPYIDPYTGLPGE